MANNLVKLLQDRMQQKSLKAIDPNTQAVNDENEKSTLYLYSRGVMAAALVGLYQFSRDEKNIGEFMHTPQLDAYPERLYHDKFPTLEEKIKQYSGYTSANTRSDFTMVLEQIKEILQEEVGDDPKTIKDFMSDQRTNILSHLPGELEAGSVLDDSTLDDRTNKMHGPFSDFTHWLGQLFSNADA